MKIRFKGGFLLFALSFLELVFLTCCADKNNHAKITQADLELYSLAIDSLIEMQYAPFSEFDLTDTVGFRDLVVFTDSTYMNENLLKEKRPIYPDQFFTVEDQFKTIKRSFPNFEKGALLDYYEKNFKNLPLVTDCFDFSFPYVTIELDTLDAMRKRDRTSNEFWSELREKYPNFLFLVQFSKPGFNQDSTQSVLYIHYMRHRLNGAGVIFLFKKNENHWQIKYAYQKWIS